MSTRAAPDAVFQSSFLFMLSLLDFEGRRLRGARPFAVFEARGDNWTWRDADPDFPFQDGRGDVLNELQRALRWASEEESRRMSTHVGAHNGGAIGFLSYDLARHLEPRAFSTSPPDDLKLPDARLVFYRELIEEPIAPLDESETSWRVRMSTHGGAQDKNEERDYLAAVARVQEAIGAGDIYQANLTRRFERALPASPRALYNRLRRDHAMPFSSFLQWDDWALVSNSPERFLRLKNRILTAQPIKGTMRRGASEEADATLKKQLSESSKDRAENVMIVDLMRNDLGRVCEYGSVGVPALCQVKTFPSLHHLVSTVEGRLRDELDGVDAIRACFPCGSITGAPKIRAMQIIDELEPVRRGAAMGAMGFFAFGGDMDWNVAIRTVTCRGATAFFHAGGGIVADSVAREEEAETRLKARAIETALTAT